MVKAEEQNGSGTPINHTSAKKQGLVHYSEDPGIEDRLMIESRKYFAVNFSFPANDMSDCTDIVTKAYNTKAVADDPYLLGAASSILKKWCREFKCKALTKMTATCRIIRDTNKDSLEWDRDQLEEFIFENYCNSETMAKVFCDLAPVIDFKAMMAVDPDPTKESEFLQIESLYTTFFCTMMYHMFDFRIKKGQTGSVTKEISSLWRSIPRYEQFQKVSKSPIPWTKDPARRLKQAASAETDSSVIELDPAFNIRSHSSKAKAHLSPSGLNAAFPEELNVHNPLTTGQKPTGSFEQVRVSVTNNDKEVGGRGNAGVEEEPEVEIDVLRRDSDGIDVAKAKANGEDTTSTSSTTTEVVVSGPVSGATTTTTRVTTNSTIQCKNNNDVEQGSGVVEKSIDSGDAEGADGAESRRGNHITGANARLPEKEYGGIESNKDNSRRTQIHRHQQ